MSHPETDLALLEIALRADFVAEGDRLRALELERAMIGFARTRQNWTGTRARLDSILSETRRTFSSCAGSCRGTSICCATGSVTKRAAVAPEAAGLAGGLRTTKSRSSASLPQPRP